MFESTVSGVQTHDFNPGIHPFPSGLFWTIPVSKHAVEVDFEDGKATFSASHQRIRDFGSITKSLNGSSGDPAVVSYTVRWRDILSRKHVDNATLHVEGTFLQTKASIEWTGTNLKSGETVTARTRGQTVITAQLVDLRNGVFFDND